MADILPPSATPAPGSGTPPGNQNPKEPAQPATAADRRQQILNRAMASFSQDEPATGGVTPPGATASTNATAAAPESAAESPAVTDEDGSEGTDVLSQVDEEAPPANTGEDEDLGKEPDKVSKAFKRIKQERKDLREKLKAAQDALRTKDAELEAVRQGKVPNGTPKPTTGVADDLDAITEPGELDSKRVEAEQVVDQVNDLLARLAYDPEGVAETLQQSGFKPKNAEEGFTPREMADLMSGLRARATQRLRAIPQRAQFIQRESEAFRVVSQAFPELADPDSKLTGEVAAVLERQPELKRSPDYAFRALIGVLGLREWKRLAGAKKAPAASANPAPPTLPRPPRGPGAPKGAPPSAAGRDGLTSAREQLKGRKPGAALAYAIAAASAATDEG